MRAGEPKRFGLNLVSRSGLGPGRPATAPRGGGPRHLRHAPFALFIAGTLVYGAAFAWFLLDRFDLVNLLRDVNTDDSFYYFQIAYHMAGGEFSTFDGGITRTNGYHPLWLFLITPFYWVFDKVEALFAIKAFEIMLVAGGVALIAGAARVARLPWILLFAALPALYQDSTLFSGLEAAAALFLLGLFLLFICLFARDPVGWRWPLAAVAFALPWVRLEYFAISVAATAALCCVEWGSDSHAGRGGWGRSVLALNAAGPLLGAVAGILVYFTWNAVVFGGIIPVSAAVKRFGSQDFWRHQGGGYSLTENVHAFLQVPAFNDGLPVALEVCVYTAVVWWFSRHSRGREDWLLLTFLVSVFGLAAGHLAKFAQSVLTVLPRYGGDPWYFVPAYLMAAIVVPVRCYVAIWFVRRFLGPKLHRASRISSLGITTVAASLLFADADFIAPFQSVDRAKHSTFREWEVTSYMGALLMNRVLPEDSVVGSGNAGVIGYFSRFPVVNLDGLANSYEYLRHLRALTETLPRFMQRSGITHGADMSTEAIWPLETKSVLFEGALYEYTEPGSNPFTGRFTLTAVRPWEGSDWFWERIEPHVERRADGAALLVDGRLAQIFARDCTGVGGDEEPVVWTWTGQDEVAYTRWTQTSIGFCASAVVLPHDALPPVRVLLPAEYLGDVDANRLLGDFEEGFDGWRLEGDAVTNHREHEYVQLPIRGNVGPGFLTSYHPTASDAATGAARSPEFTATNDELLAFRIAGGGGDGVGVRLLADGEPIEVWRGRNSEHFETVVHPLSGLADKTLQLEMFDHETGGWGHIMLDHVMVIAAP